MRGTLDISLLAGFRDIVSLTDQPVDAGQLNKTVLRVLGGAVKDLDGMRRREGEALAKDLAIHLASPPNGQDLRGKEGAGYWLKRRSIA